MTNQNSGAASGDGKSSKPTTFAALVGRVRTDEKVSRLAAHLQAGEIALINEMDLDRLTAEMIVEKKPLLVLNAATSSSGRTMNFGPEVICRAGIPLLDDLGPDLLVLKDGDRIEVRDNQVYRRGVLIAEGTIRTLEELQAGRLQNRDRVLGEVEAFAMQSASFFTRESTLLLDGEGLPSVPRLVERPLALICVPGEETAAKLKSLSDFVKDYDPVLIGVDSGAEAFSAIRRKPEVFVGDADTVSEKTLRTDKMQIIQVKGPDGEDAGQERLTNYALKSTVVETSLSAQDLAILLADHGGATGIIWVGPEITLEALFDRPKHSEMTGSFFVRLRASDKLASAALIKRLYRQRISSWQLVFLIICALLAVVAALAYTPAGDSLITLVTYWINQLFGGGTS